MAVDASFWCGRRVLLTGHTGFKGAWLALWLHRMGATVTGLSLAPNTTPSLFDLADIGQACNSIICDVRDASGLAQVVRSARPEVVFHLAAQALVRASYRDPLATYSTNVMGTAHILDALRGLVDVKVAVMVTTDKVYRNLEHAYPYREDDPLGGHDPYSASKAASEIVIASYRDAYLAGQGTAVASARAGNVIGGGDWSEDRLIPDAVRAWQSGQPLLIRSPQSIRPWQHVLEPLAGYLKLAQSLYADSSLAGSYNFGPHTHEAATVREVVDLACQAYGTGLVRYEQDAEAPHEAGWLALETAKARVDLGLRPRWNLRDSVAHTMGWYLAQRQGADARVLCLNQIAAFEDDQ